jgi:adenosylhomocysteine nucleosidase
VSNRLSGEAAQFGFVAALEREVSGLTREWSKAHLQVAGGRLALFRSLRDIRDRDFRDQGAALICAGTGAERAYSAAKALIENYSPKMLVSIGFAGSCLPELRPGSVVVPASVLESATGRVFRCAFGRGQVATLDRVAGKALKREAHERFGSLAVDMEASGVAVAAAESNIEFAAIKVISDGLEEDLGFLSDFVKPEGFKTGRFVAHIALRPGLWSSVAALQRNSKLASAALQAAVGDCVKDWQAFAAGHSTAPAQV